MRAAWGRGQDRRLARRRRTDQALRSTFTANIAMAGLAAITGVFCARLLHPAGEGELAAIQTWPLLLGTLSMLGLDSALVYFISRQPERGRQFASTAVIIALVSSLIVGVIAWFALPFLLSAQQPRIVASARVFLLVGGIFAIVGIPHGSLRGAESFTAFNLYRIVPGLAWLCVLVGSWFLSHASAIPLSRWYLAASLVCGLPVLVIANRKLRGPLRPDSRLGPQMLRFGVPLALTSLPQTINLRFDQVLIIAFLPARLLGLYVVAVSWSGGVAPLLSALGTVLFPHVSAERDTARQSHLLATALQSGALVGVASSALFMLFAPVGLPLIFGPSFSASVPSALLLVPAAAILAWSGIAEAGLQGLGRPTVVLVAEGIAAVVTVSALLLLIHVWGIFGAAVASLLGYSTVAIFTAFAISRSTDLSIRSLVIPTLPVTRSLIVGSVSLLPWRHRAPGRHRLPSRQSLGGVG